MTLTVCTCITFCTLPTPARLLRLGLCSTDSSVLLTQSRRIKPNPPAAHRALMSLNWKMPLFIHLRRKGERPFFVCANRVRRAFAERETRARLSALQTCTLYIRVRSGSRCKHGERFNIRNGIRSHTDGCVHATNTSIDKRTGTALFMGTYSTQVRNRISNRYVAPRPLPPLPQTRFSTKPAGMRPLIAAVGPWRRHRCPI